jgi:hypothetical protein
MGQAPAVTTPVSVCAGTKPVNLKYGPVGQPYIAVGVWAQVKLTAIKAIDHGT